jgi:hypothetical protein
MINEQRVEAAVEFIRDSAELLGGLVAHCKFVEYMAKVIKAELYKKATGTIQQRESEALDSPEYRQAIEDIENAFAEKVALETKMKAAEYTIEVWRSQNATARSGHF